MMKGVKTQAQNWWTDPEGKMQMISVYHLGSVPHLRLSASARAHPCAHFSRRILAITRLKPPNLPSRDFRFCRLVLNFCATEHQARRSILWKIWLDMRRLWWTYRPYSKGLAKRLGMERHVVKAWWNLLCYQNKQREEFTSHCSCGREAKPLSIAHHYRHFGYQTWWRSGVKKL